MRNCPVTRGDPDEGTRQDPVPDVMKRCLVSDPDPGLPNELDVDPEMALGAEDESAEPLPEPIADPEDPDYVEPASHAVPTAEDAGQ
jgi:hypothetical protein